jgi:anti-sigma factor RsiW
MKECTCHELLGSLTQYIDGEAATDLCAKIEAHLAECPRCKVEVDTVRRTISLVHETYVPLMPNDAKQRLYHVLQLDDFLPDNCRDTSKS